MILFNIQRIKILTILTIAINLLSCTDQSNNPLNVVHKPDPYERMIAEAVVTATLATQSSDPINVNLISRNEATLSFNEDPPNQKTKILSSPPASVFWNGPIEPLLNLIAQYYELELIISGAQPVLSIQINVSSTGLDFSELIELLSSLNPNQFTINFRSESQILELIYVDAL